MAKVEVTMPKMGESITEGTVIAWHKQPGDAVEQDETLLEIGTDKVDTEVPSPSAGTLAEHLVEEGDTVEVGAVIAMIETEADAAAAEADEPEDDVPAENADEAEDADEAEEESADEQEEETDAQPVAEEDTADEEEEEAQPVAEEEQEAEQPAAEGDGEAPSGGGEEIDVIMPKMGESITEGTIIAWHKAPGDKVDLDETIVEIGTDKVDTEVPSPAEGYLKEQLVEEGDTVEVGTKIAVLTTEEGAAAQEQPSEPSPDEAEAEEEEAQPAEAASGQPSGDGAQREPQPAGGDREPILRRSDSGRFYSPLVRSIAEEEGLSMRELEEIEGSGREGRVTKKDVMGYLENREAAPAREKEKAPERQPQKQERRSRSAPQQTKADGDGYEGRVEILEMDRMRQITAEHMIRSTQTSAHVTSFAEADVTNLVRLREKNKEAFYEREGAKLTFTPFFVEAAVEALKNHPVVNASVEENKIIVKKDYHIGIAVAIGKKGLMAPVIRHAERMNLTGLAHAAADLAERARSKQLQPDELQGGTFTVTNIGSLGSIMGTPIINQPQVGILATGAIKKRPVVIEDPELGDIIAVRHIMYACFSYDHRIIDGAMGASFLRAFTDALEAYDPDAEV